MFSPKIGIYSLFTDQVIACTEGKQQEMLSDFETALRAGEFDSYLAKVDAKRTKAQ
jgi:translation initiation factor 6 (eIF-6)